MHYAKILKEFEETERTKAARDIAEIHDKFEKQLIAIQKQTEDEEKSAYRTTISARTISSKKAYEGIRERLIGDVFSEALKKVPHVLTSEEYIKKVQKNLESTNYDKIEGGYSEYGSHFPGIVINHKLKGIIAHAGNAYFDFTYTSYILSSKQEIRQKIIALISNRKGGI